MENIPVPFPQNYILGIDIQRRDFENYGRPFYLRGEWRDHGWWYYYLYALAIKVPLGTWCLLLLLIGLRTFRRRSGASLSDIAEQGDQSNGSDVKITVQGPTSSISHHCTPCMFPTLRDEIVLLFPGMQIRLASGQSNADLPLDLPTA